LNAHDWLSINNALQELGCGCALAGDDVRGVLRISNYLGAYALSHGLEPKKQPRKSYN